MLIFRRWIVYSLTCTSALINADVEAIGVYYVLCTEKINCFIMHDNSIMLTYVDICRMPFLTVAYDDICYIGNITANIIYVSTYVTCWHINAAYFMC